MEVSRRNILRKHLEPARPLRRCFHVNIEPMENPVPCTQSMEAKMEPINQEPYLAIEQFYKILSLNQKKTADRIVYTRDFLIALATCPESRKRPEFLPAHPIVLSNARDIEFLD
ncbi:unnamed protein product [Knipowitschia caucasica]